MKRRSPQKMARSRHKLIAIIINPDKGNAVSREKGDSVMKRCLALLMALVMCLSLCACGNTKVIEEKLRGGTWASGSDRTATDGTAHGLYFLYSFYEDGTAMGAMAVSPAERALFWGPRMGRMKSRKRRSRLHGLRSTTARAGLRSRKLATVIT